jgi:hypothetical protein
MDGGAAYEPGLSAVYTISSFAIAPAASVRDATVAMDANGCFGEAGGGGDEDEALIFWWVGEGRRGGAARGGVDWGAGCLGDGRGSGAGGRLGFWEYGAAWREQWAWMISTARQAYRCVLCVAGK